MLREFEKTVIERCTMIIISDDLLGLHSPTLYCKHGIILLAHSFILETK